MCEAYRAKSARGATKTFVELEYSCVFLVIPPLLGRDRNAAVAVVVLGRKGV